MRTTARPCPRCGGHDRFYPVPKPRNGGAPFWFCNQCHYREGGDPATIARLTPRTLTPAQIEQARQGYTAAAAWCADQLWRPEGTAARTYLHQRGLRDDTIRATGMGYHPPVPAHSSHGLGNALYKADKAAYEGAILGGILGRQGRALSMMHQAITLPYVAGDVCSLIRTRKLDPGDGAKYLSPRGVEVYAGGTAAFYLHDVLADVSAVIVTEGEIKALAAWQAYRDGALAMPAVAHPGISYWDDALSDALAHKTVYLVYDSERRRDPFHLSPGELYTIRHGERLTGLGIERQRAHVTSQLERATKAKDQEAIAQLKAQLDQLEQAHTATQARAIAVKVVRLPRVADVEKVDLDGFLLVHDPAALQGLLDAAPLFEDWYKAHGPGTFRYEHGGISSGGRRLANYQARIVEDIEQHDGMIATAVHRLALQAPSGQRRMVDIPADSWADSRRAMEALRTALHEGTADDEGPETLRAIKVLSRHGDDPARRTVYTCTGWQQIGGRWCYLMPDGAITAHGIARHLASELPAEALGNHYALAGDGDPVVGARAFLDLLQGDVGAQPLALLLAGHAALALIHRFMGNGDRPAAYAYGESGALKSAFVRCYLSLFGPRFTAEAADGAPLPKWESTYNALEYTAFVYRDALFCVDDYKQATASRDVLARFLHSYSEGTSRGRMTRERKQDRAFPARGIAMITGEDRPTADTGQLGRVLLYPLRRGDVNPEALQDVQRAGATGDLAAFWRGFVQTIAAMLDQYGEQRIQQLIADKLRADDAAVPGHQRTVGALRQNRAAWLVLCRWLYQAGYITHDEAAELNQAHLAARAALARAQAQTQQEERPATIFLSMIRQALATGTAVIEGESEAADLAPPERVIGFLHNEIIALFPDIAFGLVQKLRGARALQYSPTAVYDQLLSDGLIADTDKKGGKTCKPVWYKGRTQRVLLLKPEALGAPHFTGGAEQGLTQHDKGVSERVSEDRALESPIEDSLTPITPLTPYIEPIYPVAQTDPIAHDPLTIRSTTTDRCKGVGEGDLAHQEAVNGLTPTANGKCKADTADAIAAATPWQTKRYAGKEM